MPRLERKLRYGPNRADWIPPALTALVAAALMIAVFIAWWSFQPISEQMGLGYQGRSMLLAFMVLVEILLGWRVWSQARKATSLWREART